MNALKLLEMPHFLGFLKQFKEDGKLKSDEIDNELSKYTELNKAKWRFMMIKELKDELTNLKAILNEMEKVNYETRKKWKKNETEIKLNMLNDETNCILKNLEFELKHGTLKNRYL